MPDDVLNLNWASPGPVSSQYMRETRKSNILNGPIGGGKTRTNFAKAIRLACLQAPSSQDGVRKFRLCVVHDNYRQLWRSTLPSWFKCVPKTAGDWNGAENGPGKHCVAFRLQDGTLVDLQVDFIAIGENKAEDVMRGYEPTAFFLNELDLLAEEVYTFARGRTGRYPEMSEGGPSWHGILADCNAPERHSWLFQNIFQQEAALPDVLLLKQPSGLSPHAENVDNLPLGYYRDQLAGQPEWYIARMIKNIPGFSRDGKPVYSEFSDELHFADRVIEPIVGFPLRIGVDGGGSPAAIIGQKLDDGRWLILDELVSEQGTGAIRFGRAVARLLHDRYEGYAIKAWADPATDFGADRTMGEKSWMEIFAAEAGLVVAPGPTNALLPRLEAVRLPLTKLIDGKPGIVVSSRCPVLHEGFNSGYQYRKMQVPGATRFTDEPDKNKFSHIHDALQYLISAGGEDIEIRGRQEDHRRLMAGQPSAPDWNPFPG